LRDIVGGEVELAVFILHHRRLRCYLRLQRRLLHLLRLLGGDGVRDLRGTSSSRSMPEKVGILGMENEERDEDPIAEDDILCGAHRRGTG
jgi:hypothetical protein